MLLSYTSTGLQPLTYAAYPDLTELSPKKKGKLFCMQYGRAHFSHYMNSGTADFLRGRLSGRYKLAEDYANGRQVVKAILKDDNDRPDLSGTKVDLRKPLKLIRKSLRAVDGKLKDAEFTATVTAIDAQAISEKVQYEAALRVQMEHGPDLQRMGMGAPAGGTPPPADEDELQQRLQEDQLADEALMEMKIELALYRADYPGLVNRPCLREETTYGSSLIYLAQRGAHRVPVQVHVGDGVILPSRTEHYNNLQAGAHIERITLAQLLKEVEADPDTTFSADDLSRLETLARQSIARGQNGYYYDDLLAGRPEMAGQIEVLRFSFKTQDELVQKEYVNKFGNAIVRDKPAGYVEGKGATPGKVHRQTMSSWYEGTLIFGTELGYGCRKAYEQLRDEDNPLDCHPLYIVTSPDMLGGYTESIVEQCYVLIDMACEAFAKLRHKLNTMVGSWIMVNQKAILANTLNGKPMSEEETMKSFFRNGWIIGNTTDEDGNAIGPILTAGELPFAAEITELRNTVADCRMQIEQVTGINGSISAADPASRQGQAVTQMAISGAENTLDFLISAKQSRFERTCRALAANIKCTEDRAPLTGAVPTGGATKVVGQSPTLANRVFQYKVERKPTVDEWKRLYDQVSIMLTQQLIEPEDAIFIQSIDNLKQAAAMLATRARRKRKQAMQDAQAQTSMASQQQMASAKTTAEEARATINLEYDRKIELERVKGDNAVAAAEIQKQGHIDATEMLQWYKTQQMKEQQQHAAEQNAQAHDAKLAATDAQLTSQERQGADQRQHEAEQNAQQLASQPVE